MTLVKSHNIITCIYVDVLTSNRRRRNDARNQYYYKRYIATVDCSAYLVLIEDPVDRAKEHFFRPKIPVTCAGPAFGPDAGIAVISKHMQNTQPWDIRQPTTYTNDAFYGEYGHGEKFDSYSTDGENLYLEIDENLLERAGAAAGTLYSTIIIILLIIIMIILINIRGRLNICFSKSDFVTIHTSV